jgi:hypothetical protein
MGAANSDGVRLHRYEYWERDCIGADSLSVVRAIPIDAHEFGPL